MVKLKDLCQFINGDRGKNYPSQGEISGAGEVPFINAGHIVNGELDFSEMNYISEEKYEQLNSGKVEENDLLYCLRGSLGKKAIVHNIHKGAIASSLVIIRPDQTKINSEYLFYALESPNVQEQLVRANNGSSQPNLSAKSVGEFEFLLPDLARQKNIVKKIAEVNSIIYLRKQQLEKLDELVKARFVELFGDLHSTNFPKCKMGDVCGIKHGYAFSGEFFTEEDNNILLVTPGNFKVGGGFQEKKCKFFTGEYSKEYVLNGGDLIVTMTDLSKNMDTLGYSAIVPCTDRVYLHNQRIGLFVDMSEKINRIFLMYFMQTNDYRDSIIASATGSTVHHTSPSKILDCDVFVPPMELQEKFAAFIKQTDKSKLAIRQSLEQLETLKKALMQQYFG